MFHLPWGRDADEDMRLRKINNFPAFIHNCDAVGDSHCLRIFGDFLHFLADQNILLDPEEFRGIGEMRKRDKLNRLHSYYFE